MMELMFEKFETPAVFMCKNPVLAAFSMGKSTALVLDSGAGVTTSVPVHDGYVLHMGKNKTDMAGDRLNELLEQSLFAGKQIVPQYQVRKTKQPNGDFKVKRLEFPNTSQSWHRYMQLELVRDIKESLLHASDTLFDPKTNPNVPNKNYELPDGKVLEVGAQRFIVADRLFAPAPVGERGDGSMVDEDAAAEGGFGGVQKMVAESIAACDVDVRKELYANVVLTGGTSVLPGFSQRLTAELGYTAPAALKVKVHTPSTKAEQRFGPWIGGSILGSLGSFHQMWFSRAEYEEHGVSQLGQKCP